MSGSLRMLGRSCRRLGRRPGLPLATVLTLALGLGPLVTLGGAALALLVRPLPWVGDPAVLVVWGATPERPDLWLSYPELEDLRQGAPSLAAVAGLRDLRFQLTGGGAPEEVATLGVSWELLEVLRVSPILGRGLTAGDERHGATPVALVSHRLWRQRYGGDPALVGRLVELDGRAVEVVGVLPDGFAIPPLSPVFPTGVDVWVPLAPAVPSHLTGRDVRMFHALARLREGATRELASAELTALAARAGSEHPQVYGDQGWRLRALPVQEEVAAPARRPLLVLLGSAALLLLLIGGNLVALAAARHLERRRELAVRAALGGDGPRLLAEPLAEAAVLATLGALGGLGVAHLLLAILGRQGGVELPWLPYIALGGLLPLLAATGAALTALALALPALRRLRRPNLVMELGGRGEVAAFGSRRLRRGLVVGQVATACVLLTGMGLLATSLGRLAAVEPGFEPRDAVSFRLSLPAERYASGEDRARFLYALEAELTALPEVESAGAVSQLPLSGAVLGSSFSVRGEEPVRADLRGVTPGYFESLGISHLQGRLFTPRDGAEAPPVAVVDRGLAQRLWPGADPVGQRLRWERSGGELEVVGVVERVRHAGLEGEGSDTVYRPNAQYGAASTVWVVARAPHAAPALRRLEAAVAELDPGLALADYRPMAERVAAALAPQRFRALLMGAFVLAALALAAVGLLAVLSQTVAERRRELALRLALGASPQLLRRHLLAEAAGLAGAGLLLGGWLSLLIAPGLEGLLFAVSPRHPAALASAALAVAVVTVAATLLPLRRLNRLDPASTLRS